MGIVHRKGCMPQHTEELFETIILQPDIDSGQRNALAFFGAGVQGISTARRVAKKLKADHTVSKASYLGGAQVEVTNETGRDQSSTEGWRSESIAHMAVQHWFYSNRANLVLALDGEPSDRIARAVIFATDKNFLSRGCVRNIHEWCHRVCDNVVTLIAFSGLPEDSDWLAREMVSSVPGALLWPTSHFRYDEEPLIHREALDYDEIDQGDLAMVVAKELSAITGRVCT